MMRRWVVNCLIARLLIALPVFSRSLTGLFRINLLKLLGTGLEGFAGGAELRDGGD